jgi:isopentenyl-diphosphate delta-isomerase type 1
MDELLDLVNENDEVIGEVKKDVANANPLLFHREINVCIFDEQEKMLMQQRSFNKKVYPGYWTESCAGHIPKGETPEAAAHRELSEELGFDIKLIFFEKELTHFPNETFFAYTYIGKYSGEKIVIQKEEVEQVKFFTKKEFLALTSNGEKIDPISNKWIRETWDVLLDILKTPAKAGV